MDVDEPSNTLRVLLIEDNPDDAELLTECISNGVEQNIDIVWVPRLRAALETLTNSKFDAILLDLTLPDSTGMDSLLSLRKFSTEIPIIVLTGLDDKDVALSCVKSGAQDYLVKGKPSLSSTYRAITYSVERCRADAAAKQLKLLEQREHFIAMLAHDLRSPINGIDRIISMILDGLAGTISEKQQQLLSMVSGTNKTLMMMINNVLDAYRLDAGGEQFQITRVDLDSLIAECLQDLEPIAQGKSIELRMSSTCKHKAYADNMAMRRVIINLVSNALKFTPAGGSVQVSCEQIGGAISLKVKDDGIGIAPEKLPNLFERFYQTDTQNRASGLGLGLHLCQHLMIAQKGTISCTSKPGEGSTFEVTLPIAYEESVKALIVDDNAANRMTLQRMLKRLSVESVAVSNGLEAIAAATTHSFEAVFMDIQMPGMDGFNTSKAMREAGVSAPIVAYTGFGDGTLQKFSEAGMSDVLEKPAALARVKEVIEQYIPQPWSPR